MTKWALLILAFATVGCSLDASVETISVGSGGGAGGGLIPAEITGFSVGSRPESSTLTGGYKVYHSLAEGRGGAVVTTTDNQYKVYNTIQGALVSHLAK